MSGKTTYILGLSAFYHDSAACLLSDGDIFAAAQEERFTRKKGDASFPEHAIEFCLSRAGITANEVSYVGFYDSKPSSVSLEATSVFGEASLSTKPSSR